MTPIAKHPAWVPTQDGSMTLVHPEHGQSYHSLAGAWSECREVFLKPVSEHATKHLWKEWCVLDVGFGLGLNWLCFVDHAQRVQQKLTMHSLENDSTLLSLPAPQNLAALVLPHSLAGLEEFKTQSKFNGINLDATLHLADANDTLTNWQNLHAPKFNVILQDAFSAKVSPQMWDEAYFKKLAYLCLPQAILVTYAAASSVRRALEAAGFCVTKHQGFGGKRERLVAVKRDLKA